MEKEKALLRKEVSGYSIEYRFSRKHQNNVIRIRSLSEGRHYADHTRFNLLDNQGAIKESCQINTNSWCSGWVIMTITTFLQKCT